MERARRLAEARLDLQRARDYGGRVFAALGGLEEALRRALISEEAAAALSARVEALIAELVLLLRYERRARSRRKTARDAFEAAARRAKPAGAQRRRPA